MKIIEGIENIDEEYSYPCIALGTFDGIHYGHKSVINGAINRAREKNGVSIVFTFSPHPLNIITSDKGPKLINTKEEKIHILEEMGLNILVFANFTIEFSELHPEEFIKNILIGVLGAKEIFVGFNYTFGKGGIGNTDYLKSLSKKYGIKINVIPPTKINNKIVSSTLIRKMITKGKICDVEEYLGNNYIISGKVINGKKIGTKLGFPTANLKIANKVYPPYGVYGVKVLIEDEEKEYYGIMNIGINPTLKLGEHSIEVHIFDFNRNIYDKKIIIKVLKFIREEKKFKDKEELVEQINKDIEKWKKIKNMEEI